MAILRFDDPRTVVLKYDDGKHVDGKFGAQYMWGVEPDDIFYATPALNALLTASGVKAGERVTIDKSTKDDGNGNTVTFFRVNGKSMDDIQNGSNAANIEMPAALQEQPMSVEPDFLSVSKEDNNISSRLDSLESRIKALENNSNPIPD